MNRLPPTRIWLYLLALAGLIAISAGIAGCGGGGSAVAGQSAKSGAAASDESKYSGGEASPPEPAAPLQLRNYRGQTVDLSQYKGKAVLLTFIYTHCPDVCPLIVSHIKTALALLGPDADKLQVVAVSTDPRGDSPKTVAAFLKEHGMTGRMQYLIGSRAELSRVWKDWNIVAKPAQAGRDLVEHSALIYGIAANGKITTLYPANFRPAQLVHDVPLLEEQ
jgi:protein SCO1/2